jgi:hypothetical protein
MKKVSVCIIAACVLCAAGCSRSKNPEAAIAEQAGLLEEMLQVKILPNKTVFPDFVTGQRLEGYEILAQGCAADLPAKAGSYSAFCGAWFGQLARNGWQPDTRYNADGPYGTVRGYYSGDLLLIASARWTASPGCLPDDEPVELSSVPLEKQLYTVSAVIVQRSRK